VLVARFFITGFWVPESGLHQPVLGTVAAALIGDEYRNPVEYNQPALTIFV